MAAAEAPGKARSLSPPPPDLRHRARHGAAQLPPSPSLLPLAAGRGLLDQSAGAAGRPRARLPLSPLPPPPLPSRTVPGSRHVRRPAAGQRRPEQAGSGAARELGRCLKRPPVDSSSGATGPGGEKGGGGGGGAATALPPTFPPAMADNEKLDNQRLKNFKNKGRDLEVREEPPGYGGGKETERPCGVFP